VLVAVQPERDERRLVRIFREAAERSPPESYTWTTHEYGISAGTSNARQPTQTRPDPPAADEAVGEKFGGGGSNIFASSATSITGQLQPAHSPCDAAVTKMLPPFSRQ